MVEMLEKLRLLVGLLLLLVRQLSMHDLLCDKVDFLGIDRRVLVPHEECGTEVTSADTL